jgi:uncharacterized protein YdiU (UPF0061 family)
MAKTKKKLLPKDIEALLKVLMQPYDDQPGCGEFEQPPAPGERVLRTFCGT